MLVLSYRFAIRDRSSSYRPATDLALDIGERGAEDGHAGEPRCLLRRTNGATCRDLSERLR